METGRPCMRIAGSAPDCLAWHRRPSQQQAWRCSWRCVMVQENVAVCSQVTPTHPWPSPPPHPGPVLIQDPRGHGRHLPGAGCGSGQVRQQQGHAGSTHKDAPLRGPRHGACSFVTGCTTCRSPRRRFDDGRMNLTSASRAGSIDRSSSSALARPPKQAGTTRWGRWDRPCR